MEEQTPSQSIQRKSYQTDSRPLADIMFSIVAVVPMFLLGALFNGMAPVSIATATMSIVIAVLYKVFIDVLTVFQVPARSVLFAGLVAVALSKFLNHGAAENDLVLIMLHIPMTVIAVCHLLDGWQRKR